MVGAYCKPIEFNEVITRHRVFNYEAIIFTEQSDDCIKSMYYYIQKNQYNGDSSLELRLIGNFNGENQLKFFQYTVEKIKDILGKQCKRLNILLDEEHLHDRLVEHLEKLNFQKEIILKNELGVNKNVINFVYFI